MIPDEYVLPKGCDIRIDMQTGETWAKLPDVAKIEIAKDLVVTENGAESKDEDKSSSKSNPSASAPKYQNLTKSRIQSRLSSHIINEIESALKSLTEESSWEFLEEETSAIEIGLGILEAKNFEELRRLIGEGDERALGVFSLCLQNNPLAVEKSLELDLFKNEISSLLSSEKLSKNSFKKLLRILESLIRHGNEIKSFFEIIRIQIKRHFNEHEDLDERYTEIIELVNNLLL